MTINNQYLYVTVSYCNEFLHELLVIRSPCYSCFALRKDNYAKAIIIFVVSKEIIIYILVSVSLNRLTTIIFLQWIIKPVIQQQVFLLSMTSFIAINNHGIYPQLRWKHTFLWWHWLWHKRYLPQSLGPAFNVFERLLVYKALLLLNFAKTF